MGNLSYIIKYLSIYNTLLLKYYSELYELLEQLKIPLFLLVFILFVGTSGYMILSKGNFIDSFYMTVITVATIGFGELIENSDTPVVRVFTSLFINLSCINKYTIKNISFS
jgi:voltage-gated potassium channel